MIWRCRGRSLDLSRAGQIMGIVNVTPDSFSDGGKYASTDEAVARAVRLIGEGAAIVDVGGESTRPGAAEVAVEEELARVLPVIEQLVRHYPDTVLSVDTSKVEVARAAVAAGAHVINDVTGVASPDMRALAADSGAGLVVMHMQGNPRTMQVAPTYENVVEEVRAFFEQRLDELIQCGVAAEQVVLDPGIGFGKTTGHNLELLRNLPRLVVRSRPLLLGVSRKAFIGKMLGTDAMEDRHWPTVAITSMAREQGVPLHRVHEVRANYEALRMTEAMMAGRVDTVAS